MCRLLRWLSLPSALPVPRGVAQHGSVVYPPDCMGDDNVIYLRPWPPDWWPGAIGEDAEKKSDRATARSGDA
jgi:hypothetical protein